jgi:cephalosporin-C deacetylase-like acetyl esterase
VKIACAGPAPVSGIIMIPKDKSRKYPAMVQYHGAGVRSATANVKEGFIVFNINAHGIPNGKPRKYYANITADKNLNPYLQSAEKRYEMFCYMFLRAVRALEYVRTLPEWNGKDLVVTGGSQGGVQTLAAAALDKNVTLAVPNIPAMVGSAEFMIRKNVESAWPNAYSGDFYKGKDVKAIAGKFDYIDGAFFMRRITCPIHIAVGLFDTHAAHVFAAFNDCPAKVKTITGIPDMGHYSYNPKGAAAIKAVAESCK